MRRDFSINLVGLHHFNPRTREGCDFTHLPIKEVELYFNPRTREGCDGAITAGWAVNTISIHAPAKGATKREEADSLTCSYFNPRTREGCDIVDSSDVIKSSHFNPRTREGCDSDVAQF